MCAAESLVRSLCWAFMSTSLFLWEVQKQPSSEANVEHDYIVDRYADQNMSQVVYTIPKLDPERLYSLAIPFRVGIQQSVGLSKTADIRFSDLLDSPSVRDRTVVKWGTF